MRKAGGVVDFRWGGQEGPRDAEVRAGARGGGEAGGGGVARAECGRDPAGDRCPRRFACAEVCGRRSDFNKKGSVNSCISILLNLQHGNLQKDGLFGVCQLLSDALAGPRALCG